jgi:signal transduction histidine kinase
MTGTGIARTPPVIASARTISEPRAPRWSWWVLFASFGTVICGANLVLEALLLPAELLGDIVWFGAWSTYLAVGAVVAYRRPDSPLGRVLIASGVSIQLAGLLNTLALLALESSLTHGWAPSLAWASDLAFLPAVLLVAVVLPLLFPTGSLTRQGVGLLRLGAIAWVAWFLGVAVTPGQLDTAHLANPVGIGATPWVANVLVLGGGIVLAATAVLSVGSLALRWRRSVDDERRGLAYLAVGALTQLMLFGLFEALGKTGWEEPSWLAAVGTFILIAALPVAIGLAILRAGLLDIELVLRRTLTYLAMTLAVVAVYAVSVVAVGGATSHTDRFSTSLLVTGLAAVGLSPLRERAQRQVDRMLYGRRADPYGVLRDLDTAIAGARSSAEVLPSVAGVIARSLRLPYVAIELVDTSGEHSAVRTAWGDARPVIRELPMEHHGRRVGTLLLAARSQGERFTSLDDKLLREVADHAGSAVAAVSLAQDAQESRERLVHALEEDRRRIRRDLHDHLGPVLSGITLQLDALRRMTAQHAEAGLLTDTIRAEVADAVIDVRRLVHGLRPPVLDELGLVEAVRHHADLLSGEIAVTVDADPLPALPAALEVAAYRIVTEALTNTLRHSGALSSSVQLRFTEDRLSIEVHDDGSGIAADAQRGVGLESMRERVAELGGLLDLESSRSGTTVRVELPV